MKLNRILVAVTAAVISLTACQKEYVIYTPNNNTVSFTEASASLSLEGTKFEIPIVRGVANEALSLPVALVDENKVYKLETPTVSFAAGQFESKVVVSFKVEELQPLKNYAFSVSFDKKEVSPVGFSEFKVSAMMPLEYEDYGTIAVDYCFVGSLLPSTNFTLQKAKYTTNYYRIVGLYGSPCDLEFAVAEDGSFDILNVPKANKWLADPAIEIVSAAKHPSYGVMTGYIDPDPDYCFVEDAGPDGTLVEGSVIGFDIYWTVSAGYFGWKSETMEVTKVK